MQLLWDIPYPFTHLDTLTILAISKFRMSPQLKPAYIFMSYGRPPFPAFAGTNFIRPLSRRGLRRKCAPCFITFYCHASIFIHFRAALLPAVSLPSLLPSFKGAHATSDSVHPLILSLRCVGSGKTLTPVANHAALRDTGFRMMRLLRFNADLQTNYMKQIEDAFKFKTAVCL